MHKKPKGWGSEKSWVSQYKEICEKGVPEEGLKTLHPFSHTLQVCISSIQLFLSNTLFIKTFFKKMCLCMYFITNNPLLFVMYLLYYLLCNFIKNMLFITNFFKLLIYVFIKLSWVLITVRGIFSCWSVDSSCGVQTQ